MPASKGMIFCANCLHCKVFPGESHSGERERRVKCKKGNWKTPLGGQKTYSYHTVLDRQMRRCDDYDSMGEATKHAFLNDLAKELPGERGM